MTQPVSRRRFIGVAALAGAGVAVTTRRAPADTPPAPASATPAPASATPALYGGFPRVDLAVIEKFVGLSHRDPVEVRKMVEAQPSLARASWDWGFGDWETGLGAASHMGIREIALLVLSHGAHPTIFSATMLGQLDVVKAFVTASPGIQRTPGPHGLTLLHHARVGGKDAEPVLAYLTSLGDADTRTATQPLEAADRDAVVGRYVFGSGEQDYFDIDVQTDKLGIQRPGDTRRFLMHTGNLVFFPSGVPSVRIAFARASGGVSQMTIADPEVYLTAKRQA
jgi:hypothetical protein